MTEGQRKVVRVTGYGVLLIWMAEIRSLQLNGHDAAASTVLYGGGPVIVAASAQ
jgi:hypothetical protein